MNDLKVFENPNLGKVRVVEKDGEPWFVAADVCRTLEISNARDALYRLDGDERGVVSTDTLGGSQMMNAVNESGLYTLVLGSRKPEARAFKRWVTHEVLPAIRRTGRYASEDAMKITPAMALEAAQLLQGCHPAAMPSIHKLLTDAGFDLPPLGLASKTTRMIRKEDRLEQFGKWFSAECQQHYRTKTEAARALGTSNANIVRWCAGQHIPQMRLMNVIINNFGPMPEVIE